MSSLSTPIQSSSSADIAILPTSPAPSSRALPSPLSSLFAADLSREQFSRLTSHLSREETLIALSSFHQSLGQYRSAIVDAKSLARREGNNANQGGGAGGAHNYVMGDIPAEDSLRRIVTRVRTVVQAEAVVLLIVDPIEECFLTAANDRINNFGVDADDDSINNGGVNSITSQIYYTHSLSHSFSGHVYRYKQSLNIRANADADPRYDPDLARKLGASAHSHSISSSSLGQPAAATSPRGMKFKSLMCLPVCDRSGAVTAVILCINKIVPSASTSSTPSSAASVASAAASFTPADQSLAEFLSLLAGHTLESSKLYLDSAQRAATTQTLVHINELVATEVVGSGSGSVGSGGKGANAMAAAVGGGSAKIIQRVIEAGYALVGAEKIVMYMIDTEKEELVAVTPHRASSSSYASSSSVIDPPPHRFSLSRGILGYCASSGKIINTNDARADWRFDNDIDGGGQSGLPINDEGYTTLQSLLVVPVTDHLSRPIAIIVAYNKRRQSANNRGPSISSGGSVGSGFTASVASRAGANAISGGSQHHRAHSRAQSRDFNPTAQAGYRSEFHAWMNGGGASGVTIDEIDSSSHAQHGGGAGGSHTPNNFANASQPQSLLVVAGFSKEDESLLLSVASSAGSILRRSALHSTALMTRKKTEALLSISCLITVDLQSDKIGTKIVQAAHQLVQCECIRLWIVDEAASELVCEVGQGQGSSRESNSSGGGSSGNADRIPLGYGVAGHTALTGRLLNISDAQKDWRFDPAEHQAFRRSSQHSQGHGHGQTHGQAHGQAQAHGNRGSNAAPLSVAISSLQSSPLASPSNSSNRASQVCTILAIPIVDFLGKSVGVIEIINKYSDLGPIPFDSADEDVLNSLAVTAGAVLRKSKLYDEAISRRRQTEALLTINELMSAEMDTNKVMQRIIEASYMLVDAERITLFSVDPNTGELVCIVSKDPFFLNARLGYGHGIVGHVALTRRSLNIVDAYSDPRFNQLSDLRTGYRTVSILTVPVTDRRGQCVAVIQATNKVARVANVGGGSTGSGSTTSSSRSGAKSFSPEDVLLLESMAVNAGALLQKARLFDAAVVADRKSRALLSLVMTATREDQSTDWIMHEIGRVAYDALGSERVFIFFVDHLREELTCVVGPDDTQEGWTAPLGRGVVSLVAMTGEMINVADVTTHSKYDVDVDGRGGSSPPKSVLCLGVKNNDGEVIAVVYAVNKRSAAHQAQGGMQLSIGGTGVSSSGLPPPHHHHQYHHSSNSSTTTSTNSNPSGNNSNRGSVANTLSPMAAGAAPLHNAYSSQLPPMPLVIPASPSTGGLGSAAAANQAAYSSSSALTSPITSRKRPSIVSVSSPWMSLRQASYSAVMDGSSPQSSGLNTTDCTTPASPMDHAAQASPTRSSMRSPMLRRGSVDHVHPVQSSGPVPASTVIPSLPINNSNARPNLNPTPSVSRATAPPVALNLLPPMHQSTLSSSSVEVFTTEDEDILRALCAEVRSLLLRHVRETVLEMNQLSMNEGVYSLMDTYTGVVSARTEMAAAAALAHSTTHSTTSGVTNPPVAGAKGKSSLLAIPGSKAAGGIVGRTTKRSGFKSATGGTDVIPPPVAWPISKSNFGDLLSLDFNVWTYSPDELLCLSYEIFADLRLIDEFQIIPDVLKGFCMAVRQNYHDNPFHNWYHGFSVLHFSYISLRVLTSAADNLTQHDVLALMIASLCHDIDHPGNTNSYEINTGSELALIHNDLSVLENHHAYMTFKILRAPASSILSNVRRDTFQSLKKTIVGAIMSTDMISHFSECRNLDTRDAAQPFAISLAGDRQQLVNMIIHSADLSGQCMPTTSAQVWEERITREFENQATREKEKGIIVAEFMLNLTNPLLRRQNQTNFIDVVLIPWWRATTRLFPGFKLCYKNLLTNRNYYDTNRIDHSTVPSPDSLSSTVNSPRAPPAQEPLRRSASAGATTTAATAAGDATTDVQDGDEEEDQTIDELSPLEEERA